MSAPASRRHATFPTCPEQAASWSGKCSLSHGPIHVGAELDQEVEHLDFGLWTSCGAGQGSLSPFVASVHRDAPPEFLADGAKVSSGGRFVNVHKRLIRDAKPIHNETTARVASADPYAVLSWFGAAAERAAFRGRRGSGGASGSGA